MARVLIIDDDEPFCDLLCSAFSVEGHKTDCAYCLQSALQMAEQHAYDVIYLDVQLPDGNGLDKLPEIHAMPSAPEVIIVTGAGTANGAELAIRCGAWDYICKPSSLSAMTLPLLRALEYREEKVRKKPPSVLKLDNIIGSSSRMKSCYATLSEAASCDANVLITGETGTGKELFAKAVHENSRRVSRAFVIVDCAALTRNLTESTLFGYEKGAFTGADCRHDGLIKQAHGGTLFLDEVGELPLDLQKSFLRVLQERCYRPLGSSREIDSDFRLIAATNRNLDQLVREGSFREDLLYRICSITLEIPPLREHLDDLVEIARHHTARICKRTQIPNKKFSEDFTEALLAHSWPGNVRELVNALEKSIASALSVPTLFPLHLPDAIRIKLARFKASVESSGDIQTAFSLPAQLPRLKDFREEIYAKLEKQYLQQVIVSIQGNIAEACRITGLGRARLYELCRKHQLKI